MIGIGYNKNSIEEYSLEIIRLFKSILLWFKSIKTYDVESVIRLIKFRENRRVCQRIKYGKSLLQNAWKGYG